MFVLRMIWTVMMSSVVIYGMVGYFVITPAMVSTSPEQKQELEQRMPTTMITTHPEKFKLLTIGFAVLSTLMGLGSIVVRKKLVSQEIILRGLRNRDASGDATVDGLKDAEAEGGNPLQVAAGKFVFPGYIASWALSEAVAIHGFALSQLVRQPSLYFWFGIPSLALMIVNRPSQDLIHEAADQYQLTFAQRS